MTTLNNETVDSHEDGLSEIIDIKPGTLTPEQQEIFNSIPKELDINMNYDRLTPEQQAVVDIFTAPFVDKGEAETGLSEQQDALLQNEQDESDLVNDDKTNLEEIAEAYRSNVIDLDTLQGHVVDGDITAIEYQDICGIKFPVIPETEKSNLDMKLDELKAAIAKGEPQGNINVLYHKVDAWLKGEVISETEAKALRDYLGETLNDPIRNAMVNRDLEHGTIDACRADATAVIAKIADRETEVETSLLSSLLMAVADFATIKMREGKLPRSSTMHDSLWALLVADKLFGEVTEEKDENNATVSRNDPYRMPSILSYRNRLCLAACLFAYGEVTQVQFGYIPKENLSGKRLSLKMVFQPKDRINTPIEECLRSVCVPAKVIRPHVYASVNPDNASNPIDPRTGKPVPSDGWVLEAIKPNEDDSLRYLTDDIATALYGHHFRNEELTYDTVSSIKGKVPTGFINGSKAANTNAATETTTETTRKRQTRGTQAEGQEAITKAKDDEIKTLKEDLAASKAMVADQGKGDLTVIFTHLRAVIRDEAVAIPDDAMLAFWKDVNEMFDKRFVSAGKIPTKEIMSEMVDFLEVAEQYINCEDERESKYSWKSPDGNLAREYVFNGLKTAA